MILADTTVPTEKAKNRSKRREYLRKWRKANPDKTSRYGKTWRSKNKDKMHAFNKAYHKKHKVRLLARKHELRYASIENFLIAVVQGARRNARARGRPFDIDNAFLLDMWAKQNGRCAITNLGMSYRQNDPFQVSIDKINPAGGYTRDNTQLVCLAANFAKHDFANSQVVAFFEAMRNG